jgi:hypothetical protein
MMMTRWMPILLPAVLLTGMPLIGAQRMDRYNIVQYGATGDGRTLDTAAISQAINACADAGGGTVLVPAGRYLSGPIELRSLVELRLEAGATLESVKDTSLFGTGEDKKGLINADKVHDIAVTGQGHVQGNGTAFMENTPKGIEHMDVRYARQRDAYRVRADDGPMIMRQRPGSLIHFKECRNVTIRDVTLLDAPEWTVHISDSDNADIRGIRILNNLLIPNNDGIHCVTCRNVHISDCDVQAGDDAIAITGLHGRPGALTENITVVNCTLLSRSSGVRVGYGANSIRRCTFQNLVIHDSNRGLGVFVRDEGSIADVLFDNIVIQTRLHTGWWGNGEPIHVSCLPQKKGTQIGTIEGIRFSNIRARSEHGILAWASDGGVIRDLSFSNIDLQITNSRLNEQYGGNFDLRPTCDRSLAVFEHDIPAFYAQGVNGLVIKDFRVSWADRLPTFFSHGIQCEKVDDLLIDGFVGRQASPESGTAAIALTGSRDYTVRNCKAAPGTGTFLSVKESSNARMLFGNDLSSARRSAQPDESIFSPSQNLLPGAGGHDDSNPTTSRPG